MAQNNTDLISSLKESVQIDLPDQISLNKLKLKLSAHINQLIQTDFQKLVVVLYRMDISENKLKLLLKENPGIDAGKIIAGLIIERQLQKINSRRQFRQRDTNMKDEDKW
jgi:hypothetical protein